MMLSPWLQELKDAKENRDSKQTAFAYANMLLGVGSRLIRIAGAAAKLDQIQTQLETLTMSVSTIHQLQLDHQAANKELRAALRGDPEPGGPNAAT